MADRTELEAAAAAGVISADQAAALDAFMANRKSGAPAPSGEEDLRFIRNFHDVFLAIGIALLAGGLAVGDAVFAQGAETPQEGAIRVGIGALVAALLMWGLGEVFARRRRLFLPAIAIVLSMTLFMVVAVATLYAGVLFNEGMQFQEVENMPPELRTAALIAMAFAWITPAAFYARFRLPFSLGLTGAGIAAFIIVALMVTDLQGTLSMLPALYLVLGLLLFAAGVAFDARDPMRQSRFSDNGFWLHFAAAPMILNGAFGLVGQLFSPEAPMGGSAGLIVAAGSSDGSASIQAAATLAIVIALGLISLLINRRVLIVSALLTTGVAIGVLLNEIGLGAGALAASTLITLGAFVLILGAGWHVVRRALLGWVKPDGMWARIFPPEGAPIR
jgi:hypothetical protein